MGWQETRASITLFNNWALELDQIGRPLEAEKIERRVLDLARDDQTMDAVTPMVLNNYAKFLRQLNRLDEAADFAQRAYDKAEKVDDQLVIGQSLLERARIADGRHDFVQASALLSELEPMLRQTLPPTHYAFASLAAERALVAKGQGDLVLALKLSDEAVAIGELKKRGGGAFAFPGFLLRRSDIELASGNSAQAIADANRALGLLRSSAQPGSFSSKTGSAYLALARALQVQGKNDEARVAARSVAEQLKNAVGPDHPDTRTALQLAGLDPSS